MRNDDVLSQDRYSEGVEKWSGCGYILKAEWTVFPNGSDVGCDRKKWQGWLLTFWQSNWKDGVAIKWEGRFWVEEGWRERSGKQLGKHCLNASSDRDIDVEMAGRQLDMLLWSSEGDPAWRYINLEVISM